MESQVDHGNAAQASATMYFSTEIHQPSLKALPDWATQAPNRSSPSSPVSDSHTTMKRDFESAFPDLPSGQEAKRSRSQPADIYYPDTHNEIVGNSGPTVEGAVKHDDADTTAAVAASATATATDTTVTNATTIAPPADESYETVQPGSESPHQLDALLDYIRAHPATEANAVESSETLDHDQAESICERAREEIRRHIEIIKQNSPDGQVDLQTSEMLRSEIMILTAIKDLDTAEEISVMSPQICELTSRVERETEPKPDEPVSHTAPSLYKPISSPRGPTPSPLTTCHSGSPRPSVPGSPVVPSSSFSVVDVKFEDAATQTESIVADRGSDALDDACHHEVSDNELWERELEHIRRPQPLFKGACTIVNVPLRTPAIQGVSVSASGGGMYKHEPIPKSKANPEHSSQCGTAVGNESYTVIDLLDASDDDGDDDLLLVRSSQRVGGGDLIYGSNGAQYVPSDEEEEEAEEEATRIYGSSSFFQPQSSSNVGAADDLPDYEDYEDFEDYTHDKNLKEEELTGYNKYASFPINSAGRYDHYDGAVDDRHNHEGRQTGASLNIHDDIIGVSGLRGRSRGRSNALHKQGTMTPLKGAAGRQRSRSPAYQRTDHAEEATYRESRHYTSRYATDGPNDDLSPATTSSAGADREGKHDARKVSAETRSSAWPHRANPYTRQIRQRYMKDEPEAASFYGYNPSTTPASRADKILRYQDRFADAGEIPGPRSGLRLKLDEYARDTGINKDVAGLELDILGVLGETFYAGETVDEEQAWDRSWAGGPVALYKGFPLVEGVEFAAAGNHEEPAGDCYWRSLAYSLYGMPARWDVVKAAHLALLQHVLGDVTHPRHALYTTLNARFYESSGPNYNHRQKQKRGGGVFGANLWQLLHMPHAWTPGVMQQVTADLYNLHLVTFTYNDGRDNNGNNMCSEVSVRGAYNARHVFMLFINGSHFQPLAVNGYLG
ncbi:hypothetical protein F5X97DRAFT_342405 [Nemania serpens]|nr:hypothetical protein F5X97DRAFT_342405 [Nemania serpens]